ncbi:hypothetical protein D3C80_1292820 [compost metagenome]
MQGIGSIGLLSLGALTGMVDPNSTGKSPKPVTEPIQPKAGEPKKKLLARAGRLFNWM